MNASQRWRRAVGLLGLCVLTGISFGAPSEDASPSRQKQAEAKAQIFKLQDQLKSLRTTAAQGADVAAEKKAIDEAKTAAAQTKSDPKVQAARKAEEAAWANVKKIQEEQVKQSPAVLAAQKEEAAAQDAVKSLTAKVEDSKDDIDAAKHVASRNPKLLKLQTAQEVAELQLKRAPGASESVVAAEKQVEIAHKTLDQKVAAIKKEMEERIKALPEHKALEEAQTNLDTATKGSKEIADAKAAREAAYKAYQDELKSAVASDPDVAAQQKKADDLQAKIKEATAAAAAAHQKVLAVTTEAGKNNPKVIEAQKAAQDAAVAQKKAIDEARDTRHAAILKAEKELSAKIDAKLANDEKATALRKQIDELSATAKPAAAPSKPTTAPAGPTTKATQLKSGK